MDSAATGQKDSYTLSLNVKGNTVSGTTTSGEKAKIDVVFVLDDFRKHERRGRQFHASGEHAECDYR